jgi:hypothetical protein
MTAYLRLSVVWLFINLIALPLSAEQAPGCKRAM